MNKRTNTIAGRIYLSGYRSQAVFPGPAVCTFRETGEAIPGAPWVLTLS